MVVIVYVYNYPWEFAYHRILKFATTTYNEQDYKEIYNFGLKFQESSQKASVLEYDFYNKIIYATFKAREKAYYKIYVLELPE